MTEWGLTLFTATANANAWERGQGGPLTDAADLLDPAAHELRRRQGPHRRIGQRHRAG